MLRVLFIVNIPSPYRVSFFNELGKYCDLTVLFEKTASDERDDSWRNYEFTNFKGVFLKGVSVGVATALCFEVKSYIKKEKYDYIVCANFTSPTGMIAVDYMKRHKIPYWLECDGGFAKSGKGPKELLKKYIMSGANGYFSTGKDNDEYYKLYGAEQDRIFRYPFTSIESNQVADRVLSPSEKSEFKQKLGLADKVTVLAVGQFIPRKGFDVLLKASSKLNCDVSICFVGGVPTEEYLHLKETLKLDNVTFEGFKQKDQLSEYYSAADLFVLPTREDIWGLVINEAMAYALPVVTTNKCAAGNELVKDDINGYLVDVDDEIELARRIDALASNVELRHSMAEASLSKIQEYTIENMAKRHIEVFVKEDK